MGWVGRVGFMAQVRKSIGCRNDAMWAIQCSKPTILGMVYTTINNGSFWDVLLLTGFTAVPCFFWAYIFPFFRWGGPLTTPWGPHQRRGPNRPWLPFTTKGAMIWPFKRNAFLGFLMVIPSHPFIRNTRNTPIKHGPNGMWGYFPYWKNHGFVERGCLVWTGDGMTIDSGHLTWDFTIYFDGSSRSDTSQRGTAGVHCKDIPLALYSESPMKLGFSIGSIHDLQAFRGG